VKYTDFLDLVSGIIFVIGEKIVHDEVLKFGFVHMACIIFISDKQ